MREAWVQSLDWEDTQRRRWQPTPVFLPGEFHGQRSLAGYSPWGCKQSNMTERLSLFTFVPVRYAEYYIPSPAHVVHHTGISFLHPSPLHGFKSMSRNIIWLLKLLLKIYTIISTYISLFKAIGIDRDAELSGKKHCKPHGSGQEFLILSYRKREWTFEKNKKDLSEILAKKCRSTWKICEVLLSVLQSTLLVTQYPFSSSFLHTECI